MTFIISRRLCFQIFILFILNGIWIGCGKKTPPVPPQRYIPPAVNDLSYRLEGDSLTLNWTIAAEKEAKTLAIAGCIVFRAQASIAESDCLTCPPEFEPIADLPIGGDKPPKTIHGIMSYNDLVAKGYQYVYKVNCYSNKSVSGKDSNYVKFIYQ